MQDRRLPTIVRFKQIYLVSQRQQPLFDFNSLLLNDNATKKNEEVAVGGQRSDGFGATLHPSNWSGLFNDLMCFLYRVCRIFCKVFARVCLLLLCERQMRTFVCCVVGDKCARLFVVLWAPNAHV